MRPYPTETTRLPGGVLLYTPSSTGNRPWELMVSDPDGSDIRLTYHTLDDALIDYILRLNAADVKSTHGLTPRPYRSSYGRFFYPLEVVEHLVAFHDTMPEALAAIQAGERFCEEHSEYFQMQGSGIHHYDKAARQYLMRFSAENANQMLAEVGNRVRVEGSVYDLFISHATDDKDSLVRPLAESLRDLGLKIWYDEFELRPGDSIRSSIDRGIATSSNGLVVMSPAFISKSWTQWELNGLVGRLLNGEFKLLPMWHDISRAQVESFSPSLADVIAIVTAHKPIGQIARELVSALE